MWGVHPTFNLQLIGKFLLILFWEVFLSRYNYTVSDFDHRNKLEGQHELGEGNGGLVII